MIYVIRDSKGVASVLEGPTMPFPELIIGELSTEFKALMHYTFNAKELGRNWLPFSSEQFVAWLASEKGFKRVEYVDFYSPQW